jgi:hypothetical protein
LLPNLFDSLRDYLTNVALEDSIDFIIGGQAIPTVIYLDEFVLIAEEETVLQGMIDRLSEVGKRCGMERNVKEKLR